MVLVRVRVMVLDLVRVKISLVWVDWLSGCSH